MVEENLVSIVFKSINFESLNQKATSSLAI